MSDKTDQWQPIADYAARLATLTKPEDVMLYGLDDKGEPLCIRDFYNQTCLENYWMSWESICLWTKPTHFKLLTPPKEGTIKPIETPTGE